MRFKHTIMILFTVFSLLSSLPSFSEQVSSSHWKEWVIDRHSDFNCPWQISASHKKVCSWPSKFIGKITQAGMQFELSVQLFSQEEMLRLPGSKQNWPTNITINGQQAAVSDINGAPQIHLHRGVNIIRGSFLWASVPAQLTLPDSIGLVQLSKNNQALPVNIINNRLILSVSKNISQTENQNSLKIQVFRAIQDSVPIRLTTIIKLFVSGKAREVNIGQVSLPNSESIYLNSALPARLEEDGMLRVQVKPGIYEITLGSRFNTNIKTISTNKVSPEWPEDEYISFIANSNIREVKVGGVNSIDTSLFDIPAQWKTYPTYRLKPSQQLTFSTIVQSEANSDRNVININRDIWLSFDGQDAISKDNITGKMHQGWRLNADKSVQLGRATVNDSPVLITNDAGNQGVEIRSPNINLQAVSSIEKIDRINAIGWQTDAARLTANIHLPPGWRAIYASGVDGIDGTWIQKWSLWDIFWLMVLIAVANKFIGLKGAGLMVVTLVLTFHETLAPNFLWATLLGLIALIRLPIGKYKIWLSWFSLVPASMLIIVLISITISSLRLAVYPALEKQGIHPDYVKSNLHSMPLADNDMLSEELSSISAISEPSPERIKKTRLSKKISSYDPFYEKQDLYQVGENDRVQTGPGIPTWTWNRLTIRASGMITQEQQIKLWLSSPLLTAIWRIINVLLIALMASFLLRALFETGSFGLNKHEVNKGPKVKGKHSSTVSAFILMLMSAFSLFTVSFFIFSPPVHAAVALPDKAEYPPEYLLQEYEKKLLVAPLCLPSCAALDNGHLVVTADQLHLHFTAFADADIALPLPSAGNGWTPEEILVDGETAITRMINNRLMIYLSQGKHTVTMQGAMINTEMTLNLPFNIHHFSVDAPLWLIDGVRNGVVSNNSIGLTSKEGVNQGAKNTLTPLAIKPYAIVHRTINLGKRWTVNTRVEKVAPIDQSGVFNIKLLDGEQVLSAYPIVEGGQVNVQIPKNKRTISWQSSLPIENIITLQAANNTNYSENWRVIPSSLWNVSFSGISAIKSEQDLGTLQPNWMPWPGDLLTINVSRPEGVKGDVFTTESATLVQYSGKNVQQSKLTLNVLASQGTDYEIVLAPDVNVMSLLHDGKQMNINGGHRQIVQLHPGTQHIELEFEQRVPLNWANTSAEITLPGKAVNINIEYHLVNDRWLIYINGPSLGASMLYWGVLFVILFGAIVLPFIARKLKLNMPISSIGWGLLGIGFSTVNTYGVVITALFFFAMALRKQYIKPSSLRPWLFNAIQVSLFVLTFICIASLLVSIPIGLLSSPDMQVVGNGSYGHLFRFFQDKMVAQQLPLVTIYSLPIWLYRIVMLAWSLWIATQLIKWGKWWFDSYSANGAWVKIPKKEVVKHK
ncbi:hypothetical protein ACR30L_11815 [Psychromonas sp. PT13]|uniref:hypothetical protein n=1 Tax=Psychromonas sp. PT13 TaxID=3439547 RepID=UPI003EBBD683